jgi:hypothetical protein
MLSDNIQFEDITVINWERSFLISISFPLRTTEPGSFPKNCSTLRGVSKRIKI